MQREPAEGAAPTERTEARIAYDDVALYVAIRAFDREPGRITGMLTRRDERSPSDWLKVAIDSYYDRRTAYEFGVNPAGVKTDRYYFNDGANDDSWDAVWDVQVTRDAEGWRAEFKIPFSQLRFARGGGPVGVAIIRDLPRANETATWPLIARSVNGFVSQFGTVNRPAGRQLAQAPRADAVHGGGSRAGVERRRQPALARDQPGRQRRRRPEVRRHARPSRSPPRSIPTSARSKPIRRP